MKRLRDGHAASVVPLKRLAGEANALDRRVSDLVNAAFGLTPDEVKLLWATAPPRMPIAPPPGNVSGRLRELMRRVRPVGLEPTRFRLEGGYACCQSLPEKHSESHAPLTPDTPRVTPDPRTPPPDPRREPAINSHPCPACPPIYPRLTSLPSTWGWE